jgi:hypothetical protein
MLVAATGSPQQFRSPRHLILFGHLPAQQATVEEAIAASPSFGDTFAV